MAVEKIGLNLSALQDIPPINISVNSTASGIMTQITTAGSTYLGGWWGIMILSTLLVILFWALTDESPNGKFRYTYLRGLNLSLTICSMLSAVLLITGFDNNFYTFSLFSILTMLSTIMLVTIENKE